MLSVKDIHITFGGRSLLSGADLQIQAGDRICLVGRNGSGKSTPVSYTHLTLPTIYSV